MDIRFRFATCVPLSMYGLLTVLRVVPLSDSILPRTMWSMLGWD